MRYQIYEAKSVKYDAQQRVGVERKGLLVAQKTPKTPVITGNSGF
jgi:hypothetical protein